MDLDYELLWNRFKKRIDARDKNRYSKREILAIINGLELEEYNVTVRKEKDRANPRYIKKADRIKED